jgi:hypothetical protein
MALRNIYFVYMALVGIAAGAVLLAVPQAGAFFVAPYFWVLIAVAVFDLALFLLLRVSPAQAVPINVKLAGFLLGALLMFGVSFLADAPVKFI